MFCHGCNKDLPQTNFPEPGCVCQECLDKNKPKYHKGNEVVNSELIRLLELLKIFNGGEISKLIEDEFIAFSFTNDWEIETIGDLVDALEVEMSYFGNYIS